MARAGDLPVDALPLGRIAAPVTLVVYTSLSCASCARFHREVLPQLDERYVSTGKVRIIFRFFPRNGEDNLAERHIACYFPKHWWKRAEGLFAKQAEWAPNGHKDGSRPQDNSLASEKLAGYAIGGGMQPSVYAKCMADPESLKWAVAMADLAKKDGITATPFFVIGGKGYAFANGATMTDLAPLLDAALARAKRH